VEVQEENVGVQEETAESGKHFGHAAQFLPASLHFSSCTPTMLCKDQIVPIIF